LTQSSASIAIYGSLQDFTGRAKIDAPFFLTPSVKDLVESCGVPHVEIFGLQINNYSAPLTQNVTNGDRIAHFPKEYCINPEVTCNIRRADKLPARFIADVHLGKLARLLRLAGIDTAYSNRAEDQQLVDQSVQQRRALLTRDLALLEHGKLSAGYWLRSTDPDRQLQEVIRNFNLHNHFDPFSRCISCNGVLKPVEKTEVEEKLPPLVCASFDEFTQCSDCRKVYWKGSHFKKLVLRETLWVENKLNCH